MLISKTHLANGGRYHLPDPSDAALTGVNKVWMSESKMIDSTGKSHLLQQHISPTISIRELITEVLQMWQVVLIVEVD